ncbi:MAG: glycosyltransferase family 4 protein [Candidatus Helarchaeota archaeon]
MSSFEDSLAKDTGYSVRIYNLARNLAKLGNEVSIILPKHRMGYEEIDGIAVYYIRGFLPKIVLNALSMLLGVAKSTSLYFYDLLFIFRAGRIIRQSDVVQIEQQSVGGLFIPIITKVWNKPVVADCHDVFQASRVRHTRAIRKTLETFLEVIAYRCVDALVVVSENEKKFLLCWGIEQDRVEVVPNGVDAESFNTATDISRVRSRYGLEDSRIVIFVGNMEYLPNSEAVELIASEIAPLVRKEVHNVRFLIVGRTHTKLKLPDLIFTGTVDNIAEHLFASDVAIAPLLHGSGTRLKVLEYFLCSLPVVSTTIGVEGLDVNNGVNVLIEDDITKFAIKVIKLLKDPITSTRLGKAARELVVQKYDWKKITRQLNRICHNLIERKK